jgi:hypothetical protein
MATGPNFAPRPKVDTARSSVAGLALRPSSTMRLPWERHPALSAVATQRQPRQSGDEVHRWGYQNGEEGGVNPFAGSSVRNNT